MSQNETNKPQDVSAMSFETCYAELQQLVELFEKGQMPLAESVERFERGMQLLKRCNQELTDAESRVENLLRRIEPDVLNAHDESLESNDPIHDDDPSF